MYGRRYEPSIALARTSRGDDIVSDAAASRPATAIAGTVVTTKFALAKEEDEPLPPDLSQRMMTSRSFVCVSARKGLRFGCRCGKFTFSIIMNKFRKPHGNGGRDRGPFGGGGSNRPDFRGASRPQDPRRSDAPEQFDAICSTCGRACRVPFRPNGQKPVYCRECFGNPARSSEGKESFIRRDAPGGFAPPREFREGPREIAELKQQIGALNVKMDVVLRAVESLRPAPIPVAATSVATLPVQEMPKNARKDASKKKVVGKKPGKKK